MRQFNTTVILILHKKRQFKTKRLSSTHPPVKHKKRHFKTKRASVHHKSYFCRFFLLNWRVCWKDAFLRLTDVLLCWTDVCVVMTLFVLNWRFLWIKLTSVLNWRFLSGTDGFFVLTWRVFFVLNLRVCWTEGPIFFNLLSRITVIVMVIQILFTRFQFLQRLSESRSRGIQKNALQLWLQHTHQGVQTRDRLSLLI